jgi:diadenosine tetraphosphate (Ap4A) HIT family hydrolase
MTHEVLWAGWRTSYIESTTGAPTTDAESCLFCRLQQGSDDASLVLERTATTFTVMNAYPYTNGHVMVAPLRHVGELEDLDPGEASEVMAGVQRAVRAIKAVYRPHGLNVGINLGRTAGAGVPGHAHAHALPRWDGDTNFMTTVAGVRVMPEALDASWARLRAAWPAP